MRLTKQWSLGPGTKVLRVTRTAAGWTMFATIADLGICPSCGKRSRSRHGWRYRRLLDLPAQGEAVVLRLRVSRWRCASRDCERSTFSDQWPTIAVPYARRTTRTSGIASHLGHSIGGRPGERLLQRLGIPVSDDTILRQLKRDAAGQSPPARVIGIDDWSWRRSWRYGTIVVDLERHTVVDILEDRSVESAAKWLREHPSVEIVSRDRCGLYAQAVREGAPHAQQVADRFHLVQNLRMAIEEQMSLLGRATGRALLSDAEIADAAVHRRQMRGAHRQSRESAFEAVHALRKEGLTCSEIARRTGYGRRSVAKWLTFEVPPDRRRAALTTTSPLYFEAFLARCWKDGNRGGRHLFHDVKQRGYTGSFSNLERLLGSWRRADKPTGCSVHTGAEHLQTVLSHDPVRDPDTGHAISPVVAAALCIKPRGMLTAQQARKIDALKRGSCPFILMRSLAMRFNGLSSGTDRAFRPSLATRH